MKLNIKNNIFLSLIALAISATAFGQDYISEDFLDNIEINAKSMWAENAPSFASSIIIPEKYNNESAVIIGYKRNVTLDKKSRTGFFSKGDHSLTFYENVRFKIKLYDRNAVQSFTEIYFRYRDKTDGFSAHITKPDGSVTDVSLNDAVSVEASAGIPEFFKSFFDQEIGNEGRYFKVAIPGLEPGDILEYVTVTTSKLEVSSRGYVEFTPQYEICNKKYPILYNQISIETDDKSFFKTMSLNGAPSFKKQAAADAEFYRYVFTDNDRGVEKDVNFINDLQVYPLTKFQVIYAGKADTKGALIGEKGEMKTGFSKEELAKRAWEDYVALGDSYFNGMPMQQYIKTKFEEIKKHGGKYMDDSDYVKKAYYTLRNVVLFRNSYLNDKMAAYLFGSLLFQKDIKSELIIGVSNNTGKLKDVLFDQEIRYATKVGDSIYFNFTDHSNPCELVQDLLGGEAFIIEEPSKKTGIQPISSITLPDAGFAKNKANYTITASLDSTMNNMTVSRKSEYIGISKNKNITDALKYTPYVIDDYKIFDGQSPTYKYNGYQSEEYYKSVRAYKEDLEKLKPEFVKSELQRDYSQKVKYKNFSIESDGRSMETKVLKFTEEYELADMVRKAGNKYLVNLAGLVGSQLQIKKEERIRKFDINVGYARSFTWVINFKIPAGYTADGLKELTSSVDNETGSYTSAAEQVGDMVSITINKVYKKSNLGKDKWSDMLAFVDAAYNNSFKYLLLKPKS